ncbi:MAG: hypothetical protein QM697_09720 [Lachnospiraceae bacterium]
MAKSVSFEELDDALQYFEEEQASNKSFLNGLEERFQNDAFALHIRRQTKAYDYAIRALRDAI